MRAGYRAAKEITLGCRRRRRMRKATLGAPISRGATGPCGRPHSGRRYREAPRDPARSQTPSTYGNTLRGSREIDPSFACGGWRRRPCREVQGRTPTMNGAGKSDRPIVPEKLANKDGSCRRRRGYGEPYTGTQAETPDTAKGEPTVTPAGSNRAAERVEERGLAKGNPHQQNAPRTLRRAGALSALERIRQAARRDRTLRFTALLHHVYKPSDAPGGVLPPQAGSRAGRGPGDVAAVRKGSGGQPPGPLRTAQARSVPGEAGAESVHLQDRRAARPRPLCLPIATLHSEYTQKVA